MDNALGGLDLNGVRVFLAVVELGGFREAAQQLGLPRSTVSRRVAQLEAALGQQLLQRTTRRVTPTDVGLGLSQQAGPAVQALDGAVRGARERGAAPRGLLRVTAPPTFAEAFLGELLADFATAHPEVRLALDLTDRRVDLVGGGYDVALRAGPLADSSLKARFLGETPFGCYASAAYLARHGRPRVPRDLSGHHILAVGTDGGPARWPFRVRGRRVAQALTPRVAVNSFPLLRQLAGAGLGIARLPRGLELGPHLVEVLEEYALPPVPLHAVYGPGDRVALRVRAFVEHLVRHLRLPGEPRRRAA